MSEPKILDIEFPPFVDGNSFFFNNSNIRDLRLDSKVNSYGYSSDGSSVSGTFGYPVDYFYCSGVLILNHNLKFGDTSHYQVQDHNGDIAGKEFNEVTDGLGRRHTSIFFPETLAVHMTLSFSKTEPIGQEKTASDIVLFSEKTVNIKNDFSSYDERWREKVKEIAMGDGSIHRVITISNDDGWFKNLRYEANCQFRFVSQADVESFRALKESRAPFYFQPDSVSNPQNIYHVEWTGPWNVQYSTNTKGAGYTVNMQVKEI